MNVLASNNYDVRETVCVLKNNELQSCRTVPYMVITYVSVLHAHSCLRMMDVGSEMR